MSVCVCVYVCMLVRCACECSCVMFCVLVSNSLKLFLSLTHSHMDSYADRAERIAFNALPATFASPRGGDMWNHQYLQAVNQVCLCVRATPLLRVQVKITVKFPACSKPKTHTYDDFDCKFDFDSQGGVALMLTCGTTSTCRL